jgi:pimeloyl-ACP methyl ester carboxylesterase
MRTDTTSYLTQDGYRIVLNSDQNNSNLNWLFLPGGPGLGSQYLDDFSEELKLPGKTFLIDFPGDGSNRLDHAAITWDRWKKGLIKLTEEFIPCVLVTHSFSGMVALSIPELEERLTGIVLMNTTPNKEFYAKRQEAQEKYCLPDLSEVVDKYRSNPNDVNFKKFLNVYKYYFFLPDEMSKGEKLLAACAINSECYQWSRNFYSSYESKWVPKKIPCMLVTSQYDYIFPAELFLNMKEYHRKNIDIFNVENAGHFPWLNHFDEIKNRFHGFAKKLQG